MDFSRGSEQVYEQTHSIESLGISAHKTLQVLPCSIVVGRSELKRSTGFDVSQRPHTTFLLSTPLLSLTS